MSYGYLENISMYHRETEAYLEPSQTSVMELLAKV